MSEPKSDDNYVEEFLNKIDPQQTKSGFNKQGYYQFGNETCQYCKSDRTQWVADKGGKWLQCQESMCKGKAWYPTQDDTNLST